MNRIRLYIADMDEAFVAKVRGSVAEHRGIEIAGHSVNGAHALKEIIRLRPDVLLTDIPLPELDGISLLREIRRLRRPPSVILCTRFYSDASMRFASRFGAAFFLCKPVDPRALPDIILECGRYRPESAIPPAGADAAEDDERTRARRAGALMKRLGLPPRLDGSQYLLEAALHCNDDALLKNLTCGLYADLAHRLDTTVSRVERALRNAISIAYERGALNERFPHKPTNKEFLRYVIREVNGDAPIEY